MTTNYKLQNWANLSSQTFLDEKRFRFELDVFDR